MQMELSVESGVPCIYEIANMLTGCRYVGSTTRYRMRFREHRRLLANGQHSSIHLQRSYNKHGDNAFVMRALEIVTDNTDLITREQFWMDATKPRKLYNRSKIAGRAVALARPVYSINPSTLKKTKYESSSKAALSAHGSEEASALINKAIRSRSLSAGVFWTSKKKTTLSDILSQKEKIAQKKLGSLPPSVFCFDSTGVLAGEFRSISEASEKTGATASQIYSAIHSEKYRTAAGFTWSQMRIPKAAKSKKQKRVLQIKDGCVVREWGSCVEAARSIPGVNYRGISSAATGYTKSHAGYQWVFAKT